MYYRHKLLDLINQKVNYRAYKSLQPIPILSQINPVHILSF
jgi:hypothetical protein